MNLQNSNLTVAELEAEAYQRGDLDRARAYQTLMDGENDSIAELQHEIEYEKERADQLDDEIADTKSNFLASLKVVEDFLLAAKIDDALQEIKDIRDEL